MAYMAKSKYSETGQLLDPGVDLNMEGGIAEYVFNNNYYLIVLNLNFILDM